MCSTIMHKTPLSPLAAEVAEYFAVIYPSRPARSKVMKWAGRVRKLLGATRAFKLEEFNQAIDELVAAGFMEPSIVGSKGVTAQGPSAKSGTITRFCVSAVTRGAATPMINEMDTDTYHSYYREPHEQPFLEQRVRVALIANKFEEYDYIQIPVQFFLWLTEPAAKPYLQRLPEPHLSSACRFGIQWLQEFLKPVDVFAKTVKSICDDPYCDVLLANTRLFQGNIKLAKKLCKQAEQNEFSEKKYHRVNLQSTQALMHVFEGNDIAAIKAIQRALELERDGTRKRVIYPDTAGFTLSLFSLVREGSAGSRALFSELLESRKKLKISSEFDVLLAAAEVAEQPKPFLNNFYHGGKPSILSALTAIAGCWHTDYQLPLGHSGYLWWIQSMIRQANANGYLWVLAELVCVAEITFDDETPFDEDIRALLDAESGASRHKKLGTKSLTTLVEVLPAWEYSMRELEQLGLKAKKPKAKNTANSSGDSRRLVWRINLGYDRMVDVSPLEQTLDKKGQWSGGRRVSLKRLREQTSSMAHLNAQDIAASGTIQKFSAGWGGGGPTYETNQRTVFQLIGHPNVCDEYMQRYDVVEQPAELQITEHDDGITKLSFKPAFRGSSYISRLDSDHQRVYVTHFTAAQQRIQAAIPEEGLSVPIDAAERLQKLATTLAGDIVVSGNVDAVDESVLPGNPEPLLSLEPYGASLRVRLRVEPLATSNVFFDAGAGGSVVHVQSASGLVTLQRDMDKEHQLVSELIAQSVVLSEHYNGLPFFVLNDTTAALELLSELQVTDIRCVWPSDIPFKIKAQADVGNVSLNIKTAANWFAADGSVLLDDKGKDTLSLQRLLELMSARPGSRFVSLGKDEYLALSKTLHQQLSALQAFSLPSSDDDSDEQQLHPMAALALEPLLDGASVSGDKKWKQTRKKIVHVLAEPIDVPTTLQADLRDYQVEGYVWMARLGAMGGGACLADDMGLGKTLQCLALLLHRGADGPALVVAPTSVTGNWLAESQRFSPTLNLIEYGQITGDRIEALKNLTAFDLVVVSYGLLLNNIEQFKKIRWTTVVLDEAQAIKNAATGRAKAVKQLKVDFRVVTTGTPVQNNLMDLHSLFGFLNPRLLGSESYFRQRFALPISRDRDDYARDQLQSLVAPFLLRRQKRDVLRELPSRTDVTLKVSLSPEEAALYESIRIEALNSLSAGRETESVSRDFKKQSMLMLSYLTKLRRMCCNPSLIEPSWDGPTSKLALFSNSLDELIESGHKALVFSQFVDHLQIVKNHLDDKGIRYQYLDGKTPTKQRTERVKQFQSGEGDVFLISLTAGGTGLNLTAADYVIHLDPWWNPAVEDQASDRAHRFGQQRPVTVIRMVTGGTIEEQIQELHASKRDLAESILAGTDSASLDAQRMIELLQVGFGET